MQQDGVLSARLLTSTAVGKELLDSQLQQLKTAFAQQNIQMDQLISPKVYKKQTVTPAIKINLTICLNSNNLNKMIPIKMSKTTKIKNPFKII